MTLGDFLGDQSLGSWADEMEDMPVTCMSPSRTGYGGDRGFGSSGGFGGLDRGSDRLAGYATREELPLPNKPPYTAHLGNLSFDATEGDITDFFGDCEATNVRIVEDKLEHKPKGFGYVEFASVEGLKKALTLNGTQFQGRSIRISVADPPKDRPEFRELNDWTRKGPLPELSNARGPPRSGGFGRSFDAGSDAGSDGGRRRAPFESDGRVRDFGNWERKGPLTPTAGAAPQEPRERKMSPSWGEGRSQDGSRPPRREFEAAPRREFEARPPVDKAPTAADTDNQWRSKMRPDAAVKSPTESPNPSTPASPSAKPAAPAGRPRLNLQKRTVSEAQPATPSSATSDSKASPFGAARPIDTAAKEREIEEKRQLAIRQKKEADDKAREEKRAKEAAAKAEKGEKEEKAPDAEKETESNENGAGSPPEGRNYEILRRDAEEANVDEENANGEIVDDKAVKPKEVVRDPKEEGGSWRRKSSTPAAAAGTTTEAMEDDGWSTVAAKPKGNRRGGSRALAS
ncbi:RNA-binding domain-containing protein [Saccharata proteae CBS 121410]|uniref:RNA-binding domain-containing protein n=1 Tax=Saccharata proteae CBS 121410 TaxID=1314787 RepID=A0A9P4HYH5_9PEZI|nr:RNA-binding domain-containing protein [Saccharata proteae CBS 121410]